jgi:hypothetical protein
MSGGLAMRWRPAHGGGDGLEAVCGYRGCATQLLWFNPRSGASTRLWFVWDQAAGLYRLSRRFEMQWRAWQRQGGKWLTFGPTQQRHGDKRGTILHFEEADFPVRFKCPTCGNVTEANLPNN